MGLGSKTLSELVTKVRRRADMEFSEFVSDDEVEEYIQQSWGALYDMVIDECGPQHFLRTYERTIGELSEGAGPSIYKVVEVMVYHDGRWVPLASENYPGLDDTEDDPLTYLPHTRYTVITGSSLEREIVYRPELPSGTQVRVLYLPTPYEVSDVSGGHLAGFSGWEEWVVCDSAAKCLEKEESNPAHLYARMQRLERRIVRAASSMNLDSGGRVRNVDRERRMHWSWWRR